jgi:hypothetical protein
MERNNRPDQHFQRSFEQAKSSPEGGQPAPDLLGQPEQLPHDGGLNAPEPLPPKGGDVFLQGERSLPGAEDLPERLQEGGEQSPDQNSAKERNASEPHPGDRPDDKLEYIKSLRAGASFGPGVGLSELYKIRKDREEGSV